MSKKKVLVCGATGFIGRNITERLATNKNYEVHAVRFNRPEFSDRNVTWHQADLRIPEDIVEIIEDTDIIIQAAATTSGAKDIVSRPYIHVTDNAVMNSYLFRAAFEHRVKHVIFFSCTVMYPSSKRPLRESDYDANKAIYNRYFGVGNTKVYIEKLCEFFASISDTKFTAIRHSNIYGPHDKYDLEKSHVFGATVTKVMTAEDKITIWGTGEEERDLLYVADLIDFVMLAIENQENKFELLNCGYGKAVAIKDLIEDIVGASGKELKIEYDLSKPSIKTSLTLDCTLAKEKLGWSPEICLSEGIEKAIKWWQINVNATQY